MVQDLTNMILRIVSFLLLFLLISSTPSNNPVQFQLPGLEVPESLSIDLPVRVMTQGNIVGSLEFELNYDQSILQFEEIILSREPQQWLTYTMDTGNGKVRWGGYDKTHGTYSITTSTELFILKFKVLNNNWTQTPITIGRKTAGNKQGMDIPVSDTEGYINMNRNLQSIPEDGIYGKVYPVPTTGVITLDLTIPQSGDYTLNLYDLNGQLKQTSKYNFIKGQQQITQNIAQYPASTYLLQITNNTFTKTFKLTKK